MANTSLHTVKSLVAAHPAFTVGAIRSLIFHSAERKSSRGPIKANGMAVAIVRVGRKVLIDEAKFLEWVATQNGGDHA